MKNRVLSLLLALLLIATLVPILAFANRESNEGSNQILTESVTVKEDGLYIGATKTDLSAYGLEFATETTMDAATATLTTLTMNNAVIDVTGGNAIYSEVDLIIDIKGENVIRNGIYGEGNLTLVSSVSSGKLTSYGAITADGNDCFIIAEGVTVSGAGEEFVSASSTTLTQAGTAPIVITWGSTTDDVDDVDDVDDDDIDVDDEDNADGTYDIYTPDALNGNVTASSASAASGTNVTVTATPDEGYKTERVSVKTSSYTDITVTDHKDGTYTFTMPDMAVVVTAVFNKIETEEGPAEKASEEVRAENGKIMYGSKPIDVKDANGNPVSSQKLDEIAAAINTMLNNQSFADFTATGLEAATEAHNAEIVEALKIQASNQSTTNGIAAKEIEKYLNFEPVSVRVDIGETDVTVTGMTFNVTPKAAITVNISSDTDITLTTTIDNDYIDDTVKFRLPVDGKTGAETAAVYHEGTFLDNYTISNDDYIEVSTKSFSKFSYIALTGKTAGAKIGDTLYAGLSDAVSKVKDNETVTLLKSASGDITIDRAVKFTVDKKGHTNDSRIFVGENYHLVKDEADGLITYTITANTSKATYTVLVPAGIANVTYRVYLENGTEEKEIQAASALFGGNLYEVPAGSTVKVEFTAAKSYRVVGTNPVFIPNIGEDTSVTAPETEKVKDWLPDIDWEKLEQGVTQFFDRLFKDKEDAEKKDTDEKDTEKKDTEKESKSAGESKSADALTIQTRLSDINVVKIDGKSVDSKYYSINDTAVTLTSEFVKTLSAGKHTLLVKNGIQVSTEDFIVSADKTKITSAGTADTGIVLYGVLSVSAILGMGWVARKKHSEE